MNLPVKQSKINMRCLWLRASHELFFKHPQLLFRVASRRGRREAFAVGLYGVISAGCGRLSLIRGGSGRGRAQAPVVCEVEAGVSAQSCYSAAAAAARPLLRHHFCSKTEPISPLPLPRWWYESAAWSRKAWVGRARVERTGPRGVDCRCGKAVSSVCVFPLMAP